MRAATLSVQRNPNIGLFCFATEQFCLVGTEVPRSMHAEIHRVLGVPVHVITICGTSLLGAFLSGNARCLLVPENCFDEELVKLDALKIKYIVVPTHLTCLGNNLLCNDQYCYANPDISPAALDIIGSALGVPIEKKTLAGLKTPGSIGVLIPGKGLVGQDISSQELKEMERDFNAAIEPCTVNFGSPFVRSGVVATSGGFIAGDMSTGVELTSIDEGLR